MERSNEFLGYMLERHRIYRRKEEGLPPPWTEDEALQNIYLTNVYRELDKVTIWVRENIREPYYGNENLWFMLVMARWLNHTPTLQELIDAGAWPIQYYDRDTVHRVLKERTLSGKPTFTHAYMTWGGTVKGRPKYDLVCEIFQKVWENRHFIKPSLFGDMEPAWQILNDQYGLGGFLAYEVVCDLRYTRYLSAARDKKTWGFAGPGAKRGLNWVYGRPPKQSMPDHKALDEMRQLYDSVSFLWPTDWPELEMREIEHSLCEFSKVCAYKYLGKRPKRWYNNYPHGTIRKKRVNE